MHKKIKFLTLIISVIFCSTALGSCVLFNLSQTKAPTIEFDSIDITSIAGNRITLNLLLKVSNPNDFLLPTSKISLDLYINNEIVASIIDASVPNLSANLSEVVSLPTEISGEASKTLIANVRSTSKYMYKIVGQISTFGFKNDFGFSGEFAVPEFKLLEFKFDSTNLSELGIVAVIQLANKSNVRIPSLDLNIEIKCFNLNLFVASYKNETINKNETRNIEVLFKLNHDSWKVLFSELIRSRGNFDFQLDVSSKSGYSDKISTSYGSIKLPMDRILRNPDLISILGI